MRDGFIFYESFYDSLKSLDGEMRLAVIDAICEYGLYGIEPEISGIILALFKLIRPQIDANIRRREAGKSGGAPSGNDNASKQPKTTKDEEPNNQKQPNDNQKQAKDKVKAKVKDKENDNDKAKDKEREKPEPVKRAEFVHMTDDEYNTLVSKVGAEKALKCIETLDNYKGANGKKYQSDYRAILNWVITRVEEDEKKNVSPKQGGKYLQALDYEQRTYTEAELEDLFEKL